MKTVRSMGAWGLAGLLLLAGCGSAGPREERFAVMGTFASVMTGVEEGGRAQEYAALCLDQMREVESALSLYRPDSELCRFNAMAGRGDVVVGEHLRANLELALRVGTLSGGTFDVTVGPLVKLWGFSGGIAPTSVPSAERISQVRERVGYGRIRLMDHHAGLAATNMAVDLGGIAKGYAVDLCSAELLRKGARHFVVNLAGNMRAYGRPEPSRPWQIGVRDPFKTDSIVGRLELPDGMSVSTSGNYERFVEIQGRRYAHIVDPRSGNPVEGMAGVTVLAPSAAVADAMSTALFVAGVEEGTRMLAAVPHGEALFIPDRHPTEVTVTPGMLRWFVPDPGITVHVVGASH